jgi:hypothetical protein
MSLVRAAFFAAILTFSATGCFFKKRPPAPVGVAPTLPKSTATVNPAPPPPAIETGIPGDTPPLAATLPATPNPPQAKAAPRRNRRNIQPPVKTQSSVAPPPAADPGPAASDTAPPAPPAPAPLVLAELLTDAQRADLLKRCDEALKSAQGSLERLSARTLPPDAAESMARVRVFVQQAQQARERDPQTALQLAQRAEVLARDLLKSVR